MHGFSDLEEARNVCTEDIVARLTILFGGLVGVLVNVDHDLLKFSIDPLSSPTQSHAVLAHLKT